ncbi:hypothetical protein M405DRAFT_858811 [Rhizopogon salebrosus TDB-379]|nr:hypothetical protein M405DRAFT_858811 [Rhizopogon salebrosus TDB-379]
MSPIVSPYSSTTSEVPVNPCLTEKSPQWDVARIQISCLLSGSFMTGLNLNGYSIVALLSPDANNTRTLSPDLIVYLLDSSIGWK